MGYLDDSLPLELPLIDSQLLKLLALVVAAEML